MSYQGKTDWKYNDTVTEKDMNRIEQGITDIHADDSATDARIGDRMINDSEAPTANTGKLTKLLGWLGHMIKSITGESSWRTLPVMTIKALSDLLNAHRDATAAHGATSDATPSRIARRDANGQFNVGAPTEANHVARKTDTDAAEQSAKTASVNKIATYRVGGNEIDPNTTESPYIITRHLNCPTNTYYHIRTYFYQNNTSNRAQVAIRYLGVEEMCIRRFENGKWSDWVALETVAGAQAKADAAEQNARNFSLPITGGTLTGNLYGNGSQNHFKNLTLNSGYFTVSSYGSQYGAGSMRTFYDANNKAWIMESRTGSGGQITGLRIIFDWSNTEAPVCLTTFNGNPEGNVTANPGSICLGWSGSFYVKQSGNGNTGWVAK